MRVNDPVTMYELETMLKRAGYHIEQPKGEEKVKKWEVIQKITSQYIKTHYNVPPQRSNKIDECLYLESIEHTKQSYSNESLSTKE